MSALAQYTHNFNFRQEEYMANEKVNTMDQPNGTQEATKKSCKKTIKNIPTITFEDAIQLAEAIWECSSGQKVRRLTLFDHLHKSPESGHSRLLVTASSKYGITNGGYQAEYMPTEKPKTQSVHI